MHPQLACSPDGITSVVFANNTTGEEEKVIPEV